MDIGNGCASDGGINPLSHLDNKLLKTKLYDLLNTCFISNDCLPQR